MAQRHVIEQTARVKGLEAHIERLRDSKASTEYLEPMLELERGILGNMEVYVQRLEEIESRRPKPASAGSPRVYQKSSTEPDI